MSVDVNKLTKRRNSILREIDDLEGEIQVYNIGFAQNLIETMFKTFKKGGDWIVDTVTKSHKDMTVVSPIGRVRHLWGNMHSGFGVQSAQDRRGPNSSIQGYASDMGYIAARILLTLRWKSFVSKGVDLSIVIRNIVHDALYYTTKLEELPISVYLVTHAMTTLTSKELRDTYKHKLMIGLETDLEIGSHWGDLKPWDYSEKGLIELLNSIMDSQDIIFHKSRSKKSRARVIKRALINYAAVKRLWLMELDQDIESNEQNSVFCAFVDEHSGNFESAGFQFN